MISPIEILRYVRYEDIPRWEKAGWWIIASLGPTHGRWSVLMKAPMCVVERDA